jgi:hypothetical protein
MVRGDNQPDPKLWSEEGGGFRSVFACKVELFRRLPACEPANLGSPKWDPCSMTRVKAGRAKRFRRQGLNNDTIGSPNRAVLEDMAVIGGSV